MKKISIKTFYLIGLISIGLIGLAIGSTYAIFTASAEISDPITISSNLTSSDDIMKTFEVTVVGNKYITKTIVINSGTVSNVNYGIWYLNDITDIEIGVKSNTSNATSGTITNTNTSCTIDIVIKNNSTSSKTVTLGIATSKNNIVLASNMSLVPKTVVSIPESEPKPVLLSTTITNLYKNAANSVKKQVTSIDGGLKYNYVTEGGLMSDRLGSSSIDIDGGNIRYYGANPNNYIYFNCDDYSNQTSSTCEIWRIIGVFDGKVKIMRGEGTGEYSWDNKGTSSGAEMEYGKNNWPDARLMKMLNAGYKSEIGGSLYWNRQSGTCYSGRTADKTKICDMSSIGLKNDITRNMISEATYSLLGWNVSGNSASVMYNYERTNGKVWSETARDKSWTGKIALPYPSDYGYAADLSKCKFSLEDYNDSTENYQCRSNNWMYSILTNEGSVGGWFLTPESNDPASVWFVTPDGSVKVNVITSHGSSYFGNYAYFETMVVPVLYLVSELEIKSGNGSSSEPYQLSA